MREGAGYGRLASHMEKDIKHEGRSKVYEIGYLVLPTVPEEHVGQEVQKVKALIESAGGSLITEDFPKLRQLAYTMKKHIGGRNLGFDKGYFGWVKFEAPTVEAPAIKAGIEKMENLLRFLIIETIRENTLYTPRMSFRPQSPEVGKDKPAEKISEEQIEKEIENLVVE